MTIYVNLQNTIINWRKQIMLINNNVYLLIYVVLK